MQLSLNVSGTVTVVHKIEGSGDSPPITKADLEAFGVHFMGVLDDKLAELKTAADAATASLDSAIARVQGDVTTGNAKIADLQAQVAALQAQIDAGGGTPAQLQAMDDLKAEIATLQTKADGLDPTSPSTLPPTPTNPPTP